MCGYCGSAAAVCGTVVLYSDYSNTGKEVGYKNRHLYCCTVQCVLFTSQIYVYSSPLQSFCVVYLSPLRQLSPAQSLLP